MADLVQRLNEITDDEPIERYAGELRRRGDIGDPQLAVPVLSQKP